MANPISRRERTILWKNVNATLLFVRIGGILVGLVGMVHGLSEIAQGDLPTGGYLLTTIGAFTLLPNYVITGMAALIVSFAIIVWTIGFVHKKNGALVFIILSILLFLVGGGVAQVIFFLITWGASTRINTPLTWWRKVLSQSSRKRLAKSWLAAFIISYILLFIGIGIWLIFVPPTAPYKDLAIEHVCWSFLGLGLLFQVFTVISGFAHDVERHANSPEGSS